MSKNLHLLNNLFADDNEIDLVKQYKTRNIIPAGVTDPIRFAQKYAKFVLTNDKQYVMYKPLKLIVIPTIEMRQVLQEEYDKPEVMGKSILSFYKYITSKYLNITRNDIIAFLNDQQVYQLTKPQTFRVNKPITSLFPNSLWAIDLIDMKYLAKSNYGYKYIVNVIDVFSRKIWIEAIKHKTALQVSLTLQKIIDRAGVACDHLMCDNGTEFKARFEEFCKESDIKLRHVRSYTPQANGVVEQANKQVRKLIRYIMVENNTVV